MDENPNPEPNVNRSRETAVATKAPAIMAGHDVADVEGEDGAAAPSAYRPLIVCSAMTRT
jgi:hypothetical protein